MDFSFLCMDEEDFFNSFIHLLFLLQTRMVAMARASLVAAEGAQHFRFCDCFHIFSIHVCMLSLTRFYA